MGFSKEDTLKIKGLAIILMFIHHTFPSADKYEGYDICFYPFTESLVNQAAIFFKICVSLFVFVTAYGITLTFKRKNKNYDISAADFCYLTIRRYIKMMSGFIFVFVIVLLFSMLPGKHLYSEIYGAGKLSVCYMLIDMIGWADFLNTPTLIGTFWYMSLAQIIIIIMPLLILLYKKAGALIIPISFIMALGIKWAYNDFPQFFVCMAMGIVFADKEYFSKIKRFRLFQAHSVLGKMMKAFIFIMLLFIFAALRESALKKTLLPLWDGIIPVLVIAFCIEFVHSIPIVGRILKLLGVYSFDMFLLHNFIRAVWYRDFIYGFQYAGLILIVLIMVTLVVSILIEWLKKLLRYEKLISKIQHKWECCYPDTKMIV